MRTIFPASSEPDSRVCFVQTLPVFKSSVDPVSPEGRLGEDSPAEEFGVSVGPAVVPAVDGGLVPLAGISANPVVVPLVDGESVLPEGGSPLTGPWASAELAFVPLVEGVWELFAEFLSPVASGTGDCW